MHPLITKLVSNNGLVTAEKIRALTHLLLILLGARLLYKNEQHKKHIVSWLGTYLLLKAH